MHTRLFPLCDKYDEVRHSHHLINVLFFWQKHLNKHIICKNSAAAKMSVNIFWMISFSCTHCGLFLLVQTEHHRAGFTHEFVIMKFYIFPSSGVEISPGREPGWGAKELIPLRGEVEQVEQVQQTSSKLQIWVSLSHSPSLTVCIQASLQIWIIFSAVS